MHLEDFIVNLQYVWSSNFDVCYSSFCFILFCKGKKGNCFPRSPELFFTVCVPGVQTELGREAFMPSALFLVNSLEKDLEIEKVKLSDTPSIIHHFLVSFFFSPEHLNHFIVFFLPLADTLLHFVTELICHSLCVVCHVIILLLSPH